MTGHWLSSRSGEDRTGTEATSFKTLFGINFARLRCVLPGSESVVVRLFGLFPGDLCTIIPWAGKRAFYRDQGVGSNTGVAHLTSKRFSFVFP